MNGPFLVDIVNAAEIDKMGGPDGPIREPGDDVPRWQDLFSAEELAAVLDVHAAKALRRGDHGAFTDMRYAAEALRDLAEIVREQADELYK